MSSASPAGECCHPVTIYSSTFLALLIWTHHCTIICHYWPLTLVHYHEVSSLPGFFYSINHVQPLRPIVRPQFTIQEAAVDHRWCQAPSHPGTSKRPGVELLWCESFVEWSFGSPVADPALNKSPSSLSIDRWWFEPSNIWGCINTWISLQYLYVMCCLILSPRYLRSSGTSWWWGPGAWQSASIGPLSALQKLCISVGDFICRVCLKINLSLCRNCNARCRPVILWDWD